MAFQTVFPILHSHDVPRTVSFYREHLGFTQTFRWPPPDAGELTYVQLTLGGASLGIGSYAAAERLQGRRLSHCPFELCVYTGDIDDAVDRLIRAGASMVRPPADKPWGERIAFVDDPEINPIHVASPH